MGLGCWDSRPDGAHAANTWCACVVDRSPFLTVLPPAMVPVSPPRFGIAAAARADCANHARDSKLRPSTLIAGRSIARSRRSWVAPRCRCRSAGDVGRRGALAVGAAKARALVDE